MLVAGYVAFGALAAASDIPFGIAVASTSALPKARPRNFDVFDIA